MKGNETARKNTVLGLMGKVVCDRATEFRTMMMKWKVLKPGISFIIHGCNYNLITKSKTSYFCETRISRKKIVVLNATLEEAECFGAIKKS